MKNKDSRKISIDEEKIKREIRSDIDVAAKKAGNWQDISELAYEPHDHVKRNSLTFAFPAVCVVMLAAALSVMHLFSEDFYDFKQSAKAAVSDDESDIEDVDDKYGGGADSQTESAAADAADTETEETIAEPAIGNITAHYSSDEYGDPYTGAYELTIPAYFPHEEGYTDYGSLYIYVICEGEILYGADNAPIPYQADNADEVSVGFDMKEITAEQNPQVAVAVCFVRDGGSHCETAVQMLDMENPYYSDDTAYMAYSDDTNEFMFANYYGDAETAEIEFGDISEMLKFSSVYPIAEGNGSGVSITLGEDMSQSGYDVVFMTTGEAVTKNGLKAERMYMNADENGMSGLFGFERTAYLGLYSILGESEGYSNEDGIFAVVIPRDGGEAKVSEFYGLKDYSQ